MEIIYNLINGIQIAIGQANKIVREGNDILKVSFTPTQKALSELILKGYKILMSGGSGYLLPQYWQIEKPNGEKIFVCKLKDMKLLLEKL